MSPIRLPHFLQQLIRRRLRPKGWGAEPEKANHTGRFELPAFSAEKEEQTIFRTSRVFRSLSSGTQHEEIRKIIQDEAGFRIRISNKSGGTRPAKELVTKRYTDRGYPTPSIPGDPNLFTFLAYDAGEVVGTVSIRVETAEHPLAANKLYAKELAELRAEGYRLWELIRLAVDTGTNSEAVLANLIHAAYLWAGVLNQCTYCVIEVVARHAPFYERMFGFKRLAGEMMNEVVNTNVVLLGIDMAEGKKIHDALHLTATEDLEKKQKQGRQNPLFKYAFSEDEEQHILAALKRIETQRNHTEKKLETKNPH